MALARIDANVDKSVVVRTLKQKVQGRASGLEAGGQRSEPLLLLADPTGRLSQNGLLHSSKGTG